MSVATEESQRLYHSPLGLYGFQVDGVARTYWQWTETDRPVMLALWDTGIGKGIPNGEMVLSASGWVPIESVQIGDQVVGVDGLPCTVMGVYPQPAQQIYRVTFSDGSSVRCDAPHLWQVTYWGSDRSSGTQKRVRRTEVLSTQQLLDRGVKTPSGRRKFSIPITAPVQYPEVDLPMEPYALGVVLGDGWISRGGSVQISTDKEILNALDVPGHRYPFRNPHPDMEVLRTSAYSSALRDLGLAGHRSWEKFVPEIYLSAPEADRRALLAGLLDTDGSPIEWGGVEYTSTSEGLVDAVIELAESLGGQGRKSRPRITSYSYNGESREGRPSWRANIKMPTQPHRLARKMVRWQAPTKYPVARHIESIEREGWEESTCIRVDGPDSLFLLRHHIVTHNSHLAMATDSWLFEDDKVDHVLVVAEANKVLDWVEDDFPTFTDLDVRRYAGTIKQREKMLGNAPRVMVMPYETGRNDICEMRPKSTAVLGPKMLTEWAKGKRVAIVFDEFSKLRNRSSKTYISWDYLINRVLRRTEHHPYLLGLTATTVENNPADHWNACRILAPDLAGSVADFEKNYVATRSVYDNSPVTWKNLTPENCEPGVVPLNQMFKSITMRKKKTDDDVIDFFPKKVENPPIRVHLSPKHKELYRYVEEIFDDDQLDDATSRQGFGLLRQIAGHPMSLIHSKGQYAQEIVKAVGPAYLEELGCAKVDAMLEWQRRMATQQTVIFSFYGGSIIPMLAHSLRAEGFTVSVNTGAVDQSERKRAQDAFKAGDTQIFLSSDAGAKGLNLGVGSGLLHYEAPLLYSTFEQRSNRIHRIDSRHPSVTIDTLLADDTVEEAVAYKMLQRNEWAEQVQDHDWTEDYEPTEGFLRAAERRAMMKRGRR